MRWCAGHPGAAADARSNGLQHAPNPYLATRMDALHAMGSHIFEAAIVVPLFAIKLAPGVYNIPAVHATAKAVLTNTAPMAPYRGAGRPEATYLIEQLIERAARVIGVDPIEIRRRNFIPASAMPHKIA